MTPNSFSFGVYNSVDHWGMRVNAADVLLPKKRPRKQLVPGRSGMYDYGARHYDERVLRLDCDLLSRQPFTKAQLREIAYALSGKKQLRLSEEPDKYYMAELYDPPEVTALAGGHIYSLTLEFVCEPFAYGEPEDLPVETGRTALAYSGTAPAPFLLTLRNHGDEPVSGVTVSLVMRGG